MVLAVRLKKDESIWLSFLSQKKHLNKSEAVKELMHRGFIMYELDEYKSGNISLGKLAENLDVPILEAMNLVARYNAHPDVPEDYLVEAGESARDLFKK